MAENIDVVVVDDHPLFRSGIVATIGAKDDITVVAECDNASDAVKFTESFLPDVVLLDVRLPGGGLNAARVIAARFPVVKIMLLTVSEDDDDVLRAFKLGAKSYILKGVSADELVDAIRKVKRGEVYVTPSLASRMLYEITSGESEKPAADRLDTLTEREHEILTQVATGNPNKEIAYNLHISEKTVKHYMSNILQKLQARNRVEAAIYAHDAGLGDFNLGKEEP